MGMLLSRHITKVRQPKGKVVEVEEVVEKKPQPKRRGSTRKPKAEK